MLLLVLGCFVGGELMRVGETGFGATDGVFIPDSGLEDACQDRTGGALFTLGFERSADLVVWIEDDRFIDWHVAGQGGTPLFGGIGDGPGCSDVYSWHPLEAPAEWTQAPTDCDADDKDVDEAPVGPWCPTVEVLAFDDRR